MNYYTHSFKWKEIEDLEKEEKKNLNEANIIIEAITHFFRNYNIDEYLSIIGRWGLNALHYICADLEDQKLNGTTVFSKSNGINNGAFLQNYAHQIIFSSYDSNSIHTSVYRVLQILSAYRFATEPGTIWGKQSCPECPTKSDLFNLLKLVQDCQFPISRVSVLSTIKLTLIRQLSKDLIEKRSNSVLLNSNSYRKLMWNALDDILWNEIHLLISKKILNNSYGLTHLHHTSIEFDFWLLAEYAYVVLGLNRSLKIHEHFRRSFRYESVLYQSREGYRDHLFHAMNTFLLGVFFIYSKDGPLKHIGKKWISSWRKRNKTINEWLIASLFHDFGYVLSIYPAFNKLISKFSSAKVQNLVRKLEKNWDNLLEELNENVKTEHKLKHTLKNYCDHGIFSFLHLNHLTNNLDYDENTADEVTIDSTNHYKNALHSILYHNLVKETFDLKDYPLTALLIICDELQDWQRPKYADMSLSKSTISFINQYSTNLPNSRNICDRLIVYNFNMDGNTIYYDKSEDIPIISIFYSDQNKNNYDPISRILSLIHNYERIINLNQLNLRINLYIHPLIGKDRNYVKEIEILKEYCILKEVGYIDKRLYTKITSDNQLLKEKCCHFEKDSNGILYDVVSLNFPQFPRIPRDSPILRKPPWDFESDYLEFKKAYCEKKQIECRYLQSDDEWLENYIAP